MPNDPKKPDLSEEELDQVAGGAASAADPPDPDRKLKPGLHISIGLVDPPEPDKIAH